MIHFTGYRQTIMHFIVEKIAHVPDGQRLPWWVIVIRTILFPITAIKYYAESSIYDYRTGTFTINGVKISGSFFEALGRGGMAIGSSTRIVQRGDGMITVERVQTVDDIQRELGRWQDVTFPKKTLMSFVAHIKREAVELELQAKKYNDKLTRFEFHKLRMELADVLILALGMAHELKTSSEECIREKFEINKKRQWGTSDETGVVEHIRDQPNADRL